MNMRASARKTLAAVAMAAALSGVATGVANAEPNADQAYCERLFWVYVDSYDMAAAYLEEGNMKQVNWWNTQGDKAYANYTNAGC